ncbi:phosphoenolpyruvate carboxylase [Caulobacter segnis]|uniref:phosphoenolpyruvate carboxylase n=1 Tax=Caulobacter segnis TaxID=88688 RepID=UPI00240FBBAB|nr:phosphoenolpyruvate carboxylase [Caulobacter segnis]MDG2522276.1 phosphoenolpyruvate carboxylase [Caulobacter segnis]
MPSLEPGREPHTGRHVKQNAEFLDALLTEAIRYLDGDDAADLVERARKAAFEGAEADLEALFTGLSADQGLFLARAFAYHSLLANIGEDVAGRRRHAEAEVMPGSEKPMTLAAAIAGVKKDHPERLEELLAGLNVVPVLTAHPTEVRRRGVVDREFEISRLMALRRHHLPADLESQIRADLFREIALLWRTRQHRPERITVRDEIRNALSIVRTSILPALVDLYGSWSHAIEDGAPVPPMLKLGTWLGGDRDGHPGVDGETLKAALKSQARIILDFYAGQVRKLWSDLAISTGYTEVSADLQAMAELSESANDVHRKDEPYRLVLSDIFERLSATAQKLAGQHVSYAFGPSTAEPYVGPEAFISDLETVRDSLIDHEGERLVGSTLRTLLDVARACGFHLLAIDLRQNADVHERVLHELFARTGSEANYLGLDEKFRVPLLLSELAHERPLRSPFVTYSEETEKELKILESAAEAVRDFGPAAIGAYVVSKAATVSDILEPLVLLKQVGIVTGGAEPSSTVFVSPLFETIGDLERGPDVIRAWLDMPIAKSLLGDKPVQEIMLGYSDSNKDGGYVASRRGVAAAASALAEAAQSRGAGVRFFHGRGGSVGRGGGPAAEAVLAQPPGTVQGRMRMTEQGEMIARRYGDQPTARRNLDGMAAAVLLASVEEGITHPPAPVEDAMNALAHASFEAYRALVYDDTGFEDFFWSATPVGEIAQLNIGSRPSSRTASRKIEDLRAIPWVFSWSQARFMLPGWYGFASGVEKAGLSTDQLKGLVEEYDFFSALLSNMELALAQSDMTMAARYAELSPDRTAAERIFGAVKREHDAAVKLALAIRGGEALLDNQPQLAESVQLAGHSVDPLNHLQLELLRRRRAGDEDPRIKLAIQSTVAGIAAGLRNTG